ncbi:MAG TPA: hypothetical protein VF792_09050, partial [Ktedonobacterales bacterium]
MSQQVLQSDTTFAWVFGVWRCAGPPMEQGSRANALRLLLQGVAVRKLDLVEFLDRGEMAIDQAGVGQRPEMLSRLQFWGIRRQEEPVDVVGHTQLHAGMPARAIEHQHNL